jgi:hypothetical protein
MTPCEEKGYKIGDKFVALEGSLFPVGTIVQLFEDDGTTCPLFKGEGSGWDHAGGEPGAYEYLSDLKPLNKE